MRWPDERYVKVYTRDTTDWLALGWEAHALFWELLRKSDRAGLFELGKSGTRGVSAVTGIPCDVVERALPVLLDDGCVERHGSHLLIRNYIEAQNSLQSDKARQAKAREKARDEARLETVNPSHGVTETLEPVTSCDSKADSVTGTKPPVTPICEPSLPAILASSAIPETPPARDPSGSATTPPPARARGTAWDWLSMFNAMWFRKIGRQRGGGESDSKACSRLGDLLASIPESERAEDWAHCERLIGEFLARTDKRTAEAGFPFSFFVADFNGLRIPPEKRPQAPPSRRQPAPPPSIRDVLAMENKP